MAGESIDYEALIHSALRGVVCEALARVARTGMPGEHHFYIAFDTNAPGVQLAPRLRARFADRMTIVLQHQFWNLEVERDRFAVTLSFGGVRERIVVPFAAVAAFSDPGVDFSLQFEPADRVEGAPEPESAPEKTGGEDATVVAVDFRKDTDGRKGTGR